MLNKLSLKIAGVANDLIVQLLNWIMDALRWAQVLHFGLGKHNYVITNETYQAFGKVSTLKFP